MVSMENPTKSFRQVITIVDDTGTVSHDDLLFVTPFLNGAELDLDVAGTICGSVFVDHRNRSLIVNEQTNTFTTLNDIHWPTLKASGEEPILVTEKDGIEVHGVTVSSQS